MKQTIQSHDFHDAFLRYGRKDQFSYEGLNALFDYLEDYEDSTGEEIELDVIALCCDYSEDTVEDIVSYYKIDTDGMDDEEQLEAVRDYLNENTTLVGETSTGLVYACF